MPDLNTNDTATRWLPMATHVSPAVLAGAIAPAASPRGCCGTLPMQAHRVDCPDRPLGRHCQNGGDVCLAGNADGVCCPEDSCDIDDGARPIPA